MDNWQERIEVNPKVLLGKPVIRGTRIAVELIVDLLAEGWTQEQILDNYPRLTREDILAALKYASETVSATLYYPNMPVHMGPKHGTDVLWPQAASQPVR